MSLQVISSFKDDFRFLSNFWELKNPITDTNSSFEFYTVETAYVASKTRSLDLQYKISKMKPGVAKKFGKTINLSNPETFPNREAFESEYKLELMRFLVKQKFQNNPDLAEKLSLTGVTYLIEGNDWHDNFFGVCSCGNCPSEKIIIEKFGRNHLGIILMETRALQRDNM